MLKEFFLGERSAVSRDKIHILEIIQILYKKSSWYQQETLSFQTPAVGWGRPCAEISYGGHLNNGMGKECENCLNNYFFVFSMNNYIVTWTSESICLFFFFTPFNAFSSPGKLDQVVFPYKNVEIFYFLTFSIYCHFCKLPYC